MGLELNDCYRTISYEDRKELLELIYNHKPELLLNTETYRDIEVIETFYKYPYIGVGYLGQLTGLRDPYSNIITREEFLTKLGIVVTPQSVIKLIHKFI